MTTIAYDGNVLAADGLTCFGSYKCPQFFEKLRRDGDCVYGITGYLAIRI